MSDTAYMVYDYPEPIHKPAPLCGHCTGELGEKAFEVEAEHICDECFKEWLKGQDLEDIARDMGIRVINTEDLEHE